MTQSDCLQALVGGVDMEDLGVRSCSSPSKQIPARHAQFPDVLKQYVKVRHCHQPMSMYIA